MIRLISLIVSLFIASPIYATELIFKVDKSEEFLTVVFTPHLVERASGKEIQLNTESENTFKYTVEFLKNRILFPLVFRLSGGKLNEYQYYPIAIDPIFLDKDVTMTIHAQVSPVENTVSKIRNLYATNAYHISEPNLQRLYQESRKIVQQRINSDPPSVWAVQAVYKYLEISYRAAQETVINPAEPDTLLPDAIEWIERVSLTDSDVVKRALNGVEGGVDKLLIEAKKIEGIKFVRLWKGIMDQPCISRVDMIDQFRKSIQELPYQIRRAKVIEVLGVNYENMQAEVNRCAAELATSQIIDPAVLKGILSEQITNSEAIEIKAIKSGNLPLAERFQKDREYLTTLNSNVAE